MSETILSWSNILLYGRVMKDLQIAHHDPGPPPGESEEALHNPFVAGVVRGGQNKFLENQLKDPTAKIARIYGFSYEGSYYDLPKPALFMVHGNGEEAETSVGGGPRASRAPDNPDRSGVARQAYSFADALRVWSYDKGDFSIRLDMETGPLEQILLETRAAPDPRQVTFGGSKLHLRNPGGSYGSHD
jgi:hypothetical protein